MPGKVIGKSLNLGYAGKVSRNVGNLIGARLVKTILNGSNVETQPDVPFGFPVVLNTDNTFSKFGATGVGVSSAVAANFAGIAVGEVKQVMTYGVETNGSYAPGEACDVLEIGSATVFVKTPAGAAAPVAGGKVYVVTVAGATTAIGDLVTQAAPEAGATAVELTNTRFTTGKVDANGICEITLMTRVNP